MEKQNLISLQKVSITHTYVQKVLHHEMTYILIQLCMQQQEQEVQHVILSSKNEKLERDVESLRNELQMERLLKERELQEMLTKREKEAAEHKKQLASITQELEAEKLNLLSVQEVGMLCCLNTEITVLPSC